MSKFIFTEKTLKVTAVLCIMLLMTAFLFIGGCQTGDKGKDLTFVTHDPGTPFYTVSVAFASVVEGKTDMMITPQPVTSTLAFAGHVNDGTSQFSINTATDLYNAFNGIGPFEGEDLTGLRIFVAGSELVFGIFTDKKSGILELDDLLGREFTSHLVGAGTAHVFEKAFLEATGWDPEKDYTRLTAEHVAPAWADLTEGRTEAHVNVIMPAFIEEASVRIDPWMIPLEGEIADKMVELAPVFHKTTTPKAYSTIPAGTPTIAVRTFLFSHEDVNDDIIFDFLKAATDNYKEVLAKNPEHLEFWIPEFFAESGPIPFHDGAVKFYKDIGMWNDEKEEHQQQLLAQIPEIKARLGK